MTKSIKKSYVSEREIIDESASAPTSMCTSLVRSSGFVPGTAYVGRKATRVGSTTGKHSGVVTAVGVTVRYGGGALVRNLIQTNICAEPGDSGGPLSSGRHALGITSGSAGGECPARGISLYQPIKPVLAAYGVQFYR